MAVEWRDDYLTGIELIDAQHKTLFKQVGYISDLQAHNADVRSFRQAVRDLVSYVSEHFRMEEEIMHERDMACSDSHAAEHRAMMDQIQSHVADYTERGHVVSKELVQWLEEWLPEHMMGADQDMAGEADLIN